MRHKHCLRNKISRMFTEESHYRQHVRNQLKLILDRARMSWQFNHAIAGQWEEANSPTNGGIPIRRN